jgi:hypothetical protein
VRAINGEVAIRNSGAPVQANLPLPDIEGPIDKSLGTKEALAMRLRKFAIDGEKTLQGVAELAYQQNFQV